VLWCKPCIFLSKTLSILVTTCQVTRCHNRWTPTKLSYRIWMVNYLRFNFGTLQTLSCLLSHAHTHTHTHTHTPHTQTHTQTPHKQTHTHTHTHTLLSYCPQVSLYFNCSMYFYNHFMRFLCFCLIISDKLYLDILMLTILYCHHHHHRYHRVHIY
jgi:hypothetical protein